MRISRQIRSANTCKNNTNSNANNHGSALRSAASQKAQAPRSMMSIGRTVQQAKASKSSSASSSSITSKSAPSRSPIFSGSRISTPKYHNNNHHTSFVSLTPFRSFASKTTQQQTQTQAQAQAQTLESQSGSSEEMMYPGAKITFTTQLTPSNITSIIPTYQIMGKDGKLIAPEQDPNLPKETVVSMYKHMITISVMDQILNDVQRQGRISFYMTSNGEEAIHIGSSAALDPNDVIYAQYREVGVLLWRGFTMEDCMNQCYSNEKDLGEGKQMPVHYGSKKLNFQTISSPLATQIPQATGAAYALKLSGSKNCVICYFGEGAASEGDFHPALNFAATLECPVIFFCRNNGWAISTPSTDQYRGDGIGGRGIAYGIDTIRCDGNDIWAVYNATARARELAVKHSRPVLVEAMTYRVGHHSTSDDSTRYRPVAEVNWWQKSDSPIMRVRRYLESKGWWTEAQEKEFVDGLKKEARETLTRAESRHKPALGLMFDNVYDKLTPLLEEQKQHLLNHLKNHPNEYPLDDHAKDDFVSSIKTSGAPSQ